MLHRKPLINLETLFALLQPLYGHKQVQQWRQNKAAVQLALMKGDFLEAIIDGSKNPDAWTFVRANAEEIGLDDAYMDYKADAQYYALEWLRDVHAIPCVPIDKRDRRSWVVLSAKTDSHR